MTFPEIVKMARPQLAREARATVVCSLLKAWENCRGRNSSPQEPDFVAALVIEGASMLWTKWSGILGRHGIRIAVTGIFCHQTPKVNYPGMQGTSCELGDLLWCHLHTDRRNSTIRNALLYQAKISSRLPYQVPGGDFDQFRLYATWPEFTYERPRQLKGQGRSVRPPAAPRRGAQYVLIDSRPPEDPRSGLMMRPGTFPAASCIPHQTLVDHADLGLELVDSLSLLSGNAFDDRNAASSDRGWSRVVWDLLEVAANKAFKRVRSGYFRQPRISGAPPEALDGVAFVTSWRGPYSRVMAELLGGEGAGTLFSRLGEGPPPGQEGMWQDEDKEGMSVIVVETFETEE